MAFFPELEFRAPKISTPFEIEAGAQQIQQGRNQNMLAQRQFQEADRADAERNALSGIARQHGNTPEYGNALMRGGFVTQAQAYEKAQRDAEMAGAKLKSEQTSGQAAQFKLASDRRNIFNREMGAAMNDPNLSKQGLTQLGQSMVQQGIITQEMNDQAIADMPEDVPTLRQRMKQGLAAQMSPEQIMAVFAPKPTEVKDGQSLSFRDTNPNSPTYGRNTAGAPVAMLETPDGMASRAVAMRGQNIGANTAAAGRAVTMRGQDRAASDAAAGREVTLRGKENSTKNGVMAGWKYDAGSDEWVAPPSAEFPQGKRSGSKAKSDASSSMAYVISQFRDSAGANGAAIPGAMRKATTGGIMGVGGMIGRVTDSQDGMRFDNLKEQMSTELRTLFRIPGEGALSDKEQAQYGVQLPDRKYNNKTNEAILKDVETRVKLRNNLGANPYGAATTPKEPPKNPVQFDADKERRYQEWKAKAGR